MGDEISRLKKELWMLQMKKQKQSDIKQLKRQIKAEKFAQTKGGKVFNAIGDTGLKVAKKLFTPTPQSTQTKKGKKVPSVSDVMKNIDKAVGQFNY